MDRDITRSMLDTYRHRGRRVAFSRLLPYTADTARTSCPAAYDRKDIDPSSQGYPTITIVGILYWLLLVMVQTDVLKLVPATVSTTPVSYKSRRGVA